MCVILGKYDHTDLLFQILKDPVCHDGGKNPFPEWKLAVLGSDLPTWHQSNLATLSMTSITVAEWLNDEMLSV